MRLPLHDKAVTQDVVFQSDPGVLENVGSLIYKAATDASALADFKSNAKDELIKAGVNAEALKDKTVQVVQDTGDTIFVIVPYEVKGEMEKTEKYLQELGAINIMGCK